MLYSESISTVPPGFLERAAGNATQDRKEKELMNMGTYPQDRGETGPEEKNYSTESAFDILNYNQNLIQLADSKAGNLIVINSIFLASITSFAMDSMKGARLLPGLDCIFMLLFFGATVAAIFICLRIIMTKGDFTEKVHQKDLIFFADIAARTTPENYIFDFLKAKPKDFLTDLLRRNYTTASIASRKYSYTKTAQQLTVISSSLWLLTIMVLFLR